MCSDGVLLQLHAAKECHCERTEAISNLGDCFPAGRGISLPAMTNHRPLLTEGLPDGFHVVHMWFSMLKRSHLPKHVLSTTLWEESADCDIHERIRNMTRFDFNDEETSMMRAILETYLHDLTAEISSTEKLSFREDLKKEKNFILNMLGRIDKKAA